MIKPAYMDHLHEIWSQLHCLLFTLYCLVVDVLYDLWYLPQSRVFVSEKPESELLLKSATELHMMIINRQVTCEQVLETYIERLQTVDHIVNGMVFNNFAEARKMALAVDERLEEIGEEERHRITESEPLLGVPFTVKNNVSLKGFPTANGLKKWMEKEAEKDAECVESLRAAGGIPIAVTNVPEFCLWIETSNKTFGRTCNPYDIRRTSGGSSGGEGALIAAGGSLIGVGTDVAGSIRVPSMFCGIFGLKPTPYVMSLEGFNPSEHGLRAMLQTPGPMCRYADDLEVMFRVMCLPQELEKMKKPMKIEDYKIFCLNDFKGWPIQKTGRDQREAYERVLHALPTAHPIEVPQQEKIYKMIAVGVQNGLERPYCDELGGTRDWKEFIVHSLRNAYGDKSSKLAQFSLQVNVNSMLFHGPSEAEQKENFALREYLEKTMTSLLGDDGLLILPGWPTPATYHNQTVLKHSCITQTAIWNLLGFPAISIPLGLNKGGLPLAVQVVGPPYSDLSLISLARHFDAHSKDCVNPKEFPGFVAPWDGVTVGKK